MQQTKCVIGYVLVQVLDAVQNIDVRRTGATDIGEAFETAQYQVHTIPVTTYTKSLIENHLYIVHSKFEQF